MQVCLLGGTGLDQWVLVLVSEKSIYSTTRRFSNCSHERKELRISQRKLCPVFYPRGTIHHCSLLAKHKANL